MHHLSNGHYRTVAAYFEKPKFSTADLRLGMNKAEKMCDIEILIYLVY